MALQRHGISIPLAITDLSKQITAIRRKTKTLVDYYIYPDATPSEISAYDPRLGALLSRLATLDKISYTNFAYLIDDSDALAAGYLEDIIIQLLNAIHGIHTIFVNHYDRILEEREPFKVIYMVLEHREGQLKDLKRDQMLDPRKMRPEDLRANEPGEFCSGAIAMLNGRDRGKISYVTERDLLDENRARLKEYGGAFLWWQCPSCAFRLRYHVSSSVHSNIHSTEEVRDHKGVPVEYKSAFLTKCHLFQPKSPGDSLQRRASIFGSRHGRSLSSNMPKYGCTFCFSLGKKLSHGTNSFSTGRELATHMAEKHRKSLPPGPVLQKMNVAVKEKLAEGVRRWDINFK